jgi:hypothetical protein
LAEHAELQIVGITPTIIRLSCKEIYDECRTLKTSPVLGLAAENAESAEKKFRVVNPGLRSRFGGVGSAASANAAVKEKGLTFEMKACISPAVEFAFFGGMLWQCQRQ